MREELCGTCLVAGRTLAGLSRCEDIQYLGEILLQDVSSVRVCWECRHEVRRSASFRERARRSQHLLHTVGNAISPSAPRLGVHCTFSGEFPPAQTQTHTQTRDTDTVTVAKEESVDVEWEQVRLAPIKLEPPPLSPQPLDQLKKEDTYSDYDGQDCLFRSDDSDDLNDLEQQVRAFIDGKKTRKRDAKRENARRQVKKLAKAAPSREPVSDGKVRTVELSAAELAQERAGDARRESYAAAAHRCTSCVRGFDCAADLRQHVLSKHKRRGDYTCPVCACVSATAEAFTSHYQRHVRRYECVACGKRAADKKVLSQHYAKTHEGSADAKEYKCACGKVSHTPDAHRYHRDTHKARVECDQCDKTFRHRAGLVNHRRSVHKLNNSFPCTRCDKVFRWKASLKKHMDRHDQKTAPDAPYCSPCGVSFSSVCTYQRHMRSSLKHVSESQLKFVCADCNRKFSNKTKLRDHIEEKHLHKTYACHICNKPSKNRVCLDQHIRNVHRGRPNNKMCHHCGKGFPTKVQLESHIRSHTGERPFICEFCPTTFSQQSNLYKHNRQVHLNIKSKRPPARRERPPAPPDSLYHLVIPPAGT